MSSVPDPFNANSARPASDGFAGRPANDGPQSSKPAIAGWLRDVVISLAVSAFFIIFLYQPVKVEGTSMMPTLEDQERVFINKFVYRLEPIQRGDVVVFRYPRDTSKSYIKRVIAVPGDRVRILLCRRMNILSWATTVTCRMTAETLARLTGATFMARPSSAIGRSPSWANCIRATINNSGGAHGSGRTARRRSACA